MKKPLPWLVATGLAITTFLPAALANTGLWEVYQLALQNDPKILASEMSLKAAEERVNQSFSGLLPTLSGSYSVSNRDSKGLNQSFQSSDSTSTTKLLTLSQTIYDHRIWKGLDIQKKQALKAGVDFEVSKQDLIIRVSEAYFNVLAAKDGLGFSQAELKAIEQELEQTKQKFAVGLIAFTDVHEAQARYDQALADNISAQNSLDNTIEFLREITNQYHDQLFPLLDKFDLRSPSPNNIDAWVSQSEQFNLALNARKIDKDIANENVKLNFAGHYPTVSLTGSYSDSELEDNIANSVSPSETTSIGVTVNIPIYSGGETHSKVKESQHLFQQAVHNMDSAHRAAVRQTRSAFLGIQASLSSVKALEQSTVSSQKALEATQAGFEVGTRTIVDVLNSTRVLYSAKRNLSRARYDYVINTLKLKQSAGTLDEKDIKLVDQLLKN